MASYVHFIMSFILYDYLTILNYLLCDFATGIQWNRVCMISCDLELKSVLYSYVRSFMATYRNIMQTNLLSDITLSLGFCYNEGVHGERPY